MAGTEFLENFWEPENSVCAEFAAISRLELGLKGRRIHLISNLG